VKGTPTGTETQPHTWLTLTATRKSCLASVVALSTAGLDLARLRFVPLEVTGTLCLTTPSPPVGAQSPHVDSLCFVSKVNGCAVASPQTLPRAQASLLLRAE